MTPRIEGRDNIQILVPPEEQRPRALRRLDGQVHARHLDSVFVRRARGATVRDVPYVHAYLKATTAVREDEVEGMRFGEEQDVPSGSPWPCQHAVQQRSLWKSARLGRHRRQTFVG